MKTNLFVERVGHQNGHPPPPPMERSAVVSALLLFCSSFALAFPRYHVFMHYCIDATQVWLLW